MQILGLLLVFLIVALVCGIMEFRKWFLERKIVKFFRSDEFLELKQKVCGLTSEFNELDTYSKRLVINMLGGSSNQSLIASIENDSRRNYTHSGLFEIECQSNVYNCSRQVVQKAKFDIFKYVWLFGSLCG
jgi:hypothetical protein